MQTESAGTTHQITGSHAPQRPGGTSAGSLGPNKAELENHWSEA